MTVFSIKIIAVICMVIDHIGVIFFPHVLWLRMIGRIAFPLFAWLIANGAQHTANIKRYFILLLIVALVAQIPYILAIREVYPSFWDLNAVFSLAFGLLAITLTKNARNTFVVLAAFLFATFAVLLKVDYGYVGVLSVVSFYILFYDFKKLFLVQAVLFIVPYWLPVLLQVIHQKAITQTAVNMVEPIGLLSLFIIYRYNGKLGPKMKYFFYTFYPLHLFLLFLIKRFVT